MSLIKTSHYDPSLILFGLEKELKNIIQLNKASKLPKVLMLSGDKGIGKFTLIYHFLTNYFDQKNYNLKDFKINVSSSFNQQFLNNTFPNTIYINGSNLKVEETRNLKNNILKTPIIQKERFIIFDDVELLNTSSLNALLKIIEEPTLNNNFILINNQKKKIIETIYSRSLEFKIKYNNKERIKAIESLIRLYNLENINIEYNTSNISPGNFLKFNKICVHQKIDLNDDYLENFSLLINLYKKEKNSDIIDLILYLTEIYFYKASQKKNKNLEKIIDDKSFVISNLDKFLLYNINQNALINAINNRFK